MSIIEGNLEFGIFSSTVSGYVIHPSIQGFTPTPSSIIQLYSATEAWLPKNYYYSAKKKKGYIFTVLYKYSYIKIDFLKKGGFLKAIITLQKKIMCSL